MKDPTTPAEWQEAVDLAEVLLLIDSARKYGLITGGPGVDADRCDRLLAEGRRRGVRPRPHAANDLMQGLMAPRK